MSLNVGNDDDRAGRMTGADGAALAVRSTAVAKAEQPKGRIARVLDSDLLYSLSRSPVTIIAAIVTVLMILAALMAPVIAPYAPYDPASLNLMDGFTPPGEPNQFTGNVYLMGADNQGRDVFSTILYGTRLSLLIGVSAVGLAMFIGILAGLVAGYRGGWAETIIMRAADIQLTFPSILVALLIFGIVRGYATPPPGLEDISAFRSWVASIDKETLALAVLILSIGLSEWVQFARVVRGATLVEKNKEYVAAARLIGRSSWAIMLRHILPNVLGPVLVIATIGLALAIIAEATLSFLGVGMPPTQPSLGTLIRIGQDFLFSGEWWILFFPAVTLLALALSVNLLGDWLRDALNPRLR